MKRSVLVDYLNDYLALADFQDLGPQGLQVETDNSAVDRVALAVDVAPVIIEAAAAWGADMLLVHHGIFWGGEARIAGPFGARVRALMRHGVNLYAAHLALDAHPEVGNNAVLARELGVTVADWWLADYGRPLALLGDAAAGTTLTSLVERLDALLGGQAHVLAHGPDEVRRVAVLTGSGAGAIPLAAAMGADTFVTGETSHKNYWAAADHGINVVYGGHYATETVGVQALGEHLADRFGVTTRFFDFPTEM